MRFNKTISHTFSICLIVRAGLLLVALLMPTLLQAAVQEFNIYTEEYPPYNYSKDGKVTGISTEIVREMLSRLGHPDNIRVSSWSKAYRLVQETDNSILYSTTRTAAREDLFKWVGPLVPNNISFFARANSGISITSLDDARKVGRIGVYIDDIGEILLKGEGFTNLRSVPDNVTNIKDLVDGKIDLWIMNELTGKQMAKEQGVAKQIEKVFDVQETFMYIAFPKSTPDAVIRQWQQVLDQLKDDGTYGKIFSQWIVFSLNREDENSQQLLFSTEEQAWLDQHPRIKIATQPDLAPFQFTSETGAAVGITHDYLTLIARKLGVSIQPVISENWQQSLALVKSGEADLLSGTEQTPALKQNLAFTSPYTSFPDVIVERDNDARTTSLDQLRGKTLAMVPGHMINDFIRQNYPGIRMIPKPDAASVLRSVSSGETDAATLNLALASYLIDKLKISNLRVSAKSGFSYPLSFAMRQDSIVLKQLIEKVLNSISEEERKTIEHQWIPTQQSLEGELKGRLQTLTEEEKSWLYRHPEITIVSDPSWPPIEFFDNDGRYSGITADYMALLEQRLGVKFKAQHVKSWNKVLEAAKARDIDIITAAVSTPERSEYMQFTRPYLHLPTVIIVDDRLKGVLQIEDLKGKRVSVVEGYSLYDYIRDNYPEIIVDPVFNTVEGLRNVSFGKSDAFISNPAIASVLMEKEMIPNLRFAGDSGYTYNLAMASRKDWPILNSILTKGLDSITEQERQKIFRKWVPLNEKPWITLSQFIIGLAAVLSIVFVIGIVVWNQQLRKTVAIRTQELRSSEKNFRNLFKTAQVGLFRTSIDGSKIFAANREFERLFGYENVADFKSNFVPLASYVDPQQREQLVERLYRENEVREFEYLGKRLDGEVRSFLINAIITPDKGYIDGAILDITERKKSEELIRKLAMTDPLTGLANRNQFNAMLASAIAYRNRYDHVIGLLLIDLDDFKPVNDNYGHLVGDELLLHIAKILDESFRANDTVARIGGDEFAVILNGVKSKDNALRLAQKALQEIAQPVLIRQQTINVGASIGLGFFPDANDDVEAMLSKTDKALYQAKALGKNQIFVYDA